MKYSKHNFLDKMYYKQLIKGYYTYNFLRLQFITSILTHKDDADIESS